MLIINENIIINEVVMDVFNSSFDLMRGVFLLGAVMALFYKKRLGVTPGGVIVPGTLAGIVFSSFIAFMIVVGLSLVCLLIYKFIFSRFVLSKRWSSFIMISISVSLGLVTMTVADITQFVNQEFLLLSLVTPGLITISARNYGLGKVMFGTLLVTGIACVAGLIISNILPYQSLTYLSVQLAAFTPLTLVNPYIVIPVSLVISILIYYRFGIRGGGYLIAPFLAVVLMSSPVQFGLIMLGVILSFLTVKAIQNHTLITGLERFVISLFCGYFVITLIDLLAVSVGIGEGYRPAPIVLIIAVAVLTNDLSLQSAKQTIKKGFSPSLITSFLTRLAV